MPTPKKTDPKKEPDPKNWIKELQAAARTYVTKKEELTRLKFSKRSRGVPILL